MISLCTVSVSQTVSRVPEHEKQARYWLAWSPLSQASQDFTDETTLSVSTRDCCISRCHQSDLFSLSQARRVTPNDGKGVHERRPVLG